MTDLKHVALFARKGTDCLGKYAGDAELHLRLLFDMVSLQLVAAAHQPLLPCYRRMQTFDYIVDVIWAIKLTALQISKHLLACQSTALGEASESTIHSVLSHSHCTSISFTKSKPMV